jgi:general stress protein YciG
MTEKNGGKMTVEEAGRKGGEATSESHEREFY